MEELRESLEADAETYRKSLSEDPDGHLRDIHANEEGFLERLRETWHRPLILFKTCRHLALTTGNEFNKQRTQPDLLSETMFRLHARVCLIAAEIEVLMKAGLSSGALTRWRSMHEVGVVLQFLAKHPTCIQAFIDHEQVASYKGVISFNKVYGRTPKAFPQDVVNMLKQKHDDAVAHYGPFFKHDNGWAGVVMGYSPNFAQLEDEVGLKNLRPDYKFASQSVHANVKGIRFELGLYPRTTANMMLVGPSNIGLADPGSRALNTLLLGTATVNALMPSRLGTVHIIALQGLVAEANQAFSDVHFGIVADEA
jgi:hypothetical protein